MEEERKDADHGFPHQIFDATFDQLEDRFGRTGRGRRPTVTTLPAPTNRLLVQLTVLKERTDSSWDTVTEWYSNLFGNDSGNVTRGRLEHKCKKAIERLKTSPQTTEQLSFLDCPVCFVDEVPEVLLRLGLSRHVLLTVNPNDFDTSNINPSFVTKEIVLCLETFCVKENLPLTTIYRWIGKLCDSFFTPAQIRNKVSTICKTGKKLKKGNKTKFQEFSCEPFLSSTSTNVPKSSVKPVRSKELEELKKCKSQVCTLKDENMKLVEERRVLVEEKKVLVEEKKDLLTSMDAKAKIEDELKCVKATKKSLESELSCLKERKTYRENTKLREENSCLQNKVALQREQGNLHLKSNPNQTISELKCKLKNEQSLKSKWKKKCNRLQQDDKDIEIPVPDQTSESGIQLKLKDDRNNKYSFEVRKTFMALQGAGVAASKCSEVVGIVSEGLFDTEVKKLPSTQSVLNFADEGHCIAKYQVAEKLLQSNHATFASDGTSRSKVHYIERHVVLDDGSMFSLGYTEIASDDAKSMLEQSKDVLEELTRLYCVDCEGEEQYLEKVNKTLVEILTKIKALMSDRAANMKAFDRLFSEYKSDTLGGYDSAEPSTLFLFCNAHFLLGLSSATEKCLRLVEDELIQQESTLGCENPLSKELVTLRLIRCAADVFGPRGDEKCGSRHEWLAYCEKLGVKSAFTSYRSNRFNNLYENACAVLFHREHIVDFLSNFCSHSNSKLLCVLADVKDKHVLSMISALASFHHIVTGPYWMLMNSDRSYGEFPTYVKLMESTFSHLETEFDSVQQKHESMFEDFKLKNHETTCDLHAFISSEMCIPKLRSRTFLNILSHSRIVLNNQLGEFLDGGVFGGNIDESVLDILNKCPLNNLTGEQIFGDLDYDMSKRRRCTTHHRSTISMWKHNHVTSWLNRKSRKEQLKIFNFAQKSSKLLRNEHKEAEAQEKLKIRKKIEENERKKTEKDLKAKTQKNAVLDSILARGFCQTRKELDYLYKSGKVEDLKNQIRYRKIFLEEQNLNITGTKEQLYKALCSCVTGNSDSDDEPTCSKSKKRKPNHSSSQ